MNTVDLETLQRFTAQAQRLQAIAAELKPRYTQSGKAYTRVGIAIKNSFAKDRVVDFFNLVAWEKSAEFLHKWFRKGSRILVSGRLQSSAYEKNGVKINSTDVLIENIEFAGGKFEGKPTAETDNDFDDIPF